MEKTIEEQMAEKQAGFRTGRGTVEQIFEEPYMIFISER